MQSHLILSIVLWAVTTSAVPPGYQSGAAKELTLPSFDPGSQIPPVWGSSWTSKQVFFLCSARSPPSVHPPPTPPPPPPPPPPNSDPANRVTSIHPSQIDSRARKAIQDGKAVPLITHQYKRLILQEIQDQDMCKHYRPKAGTWWDENPEAVLKRVMRGGWTDVEITSKTPTVAKPAVPRGTEGWLDLEHDEAGTSDAQPVGHHDVKAMLSKTLDRLGHFTSTVAGNVRTSPSFASPGVGRLGNLPLGAVPVLEPIPWLAL
ncbi:MAG: hypothetical protein M1816_005781 [Peltula sp. TS41687]|nr:MAG: hypothetical protein M1816_005781 [Peltula sp. TS41687]